MRRTPSINAIAGRRVEKALTINNYGKPAARFSPRANADDGRMECICRNGLDTRDDRPYALDPSVVHCPLSYAYDTCIIRACAY